MTKDDKSIGHENLRISLGHQTDNIHLRQFCGLSSENRVAEYLQVFWKLWSRNFFVLCRK